MKTDATAVTHFFQIAPTSTSPRLSNTKIFPRFLRTISSEAEIVVGIIQAMKQFKWSRIAVITQNDNLFTFVSCNKFCTVKINVAIYMNIDFHSTEGEACCIKSTVNTRIYI